MQFKTGSYIVTANKIWKCKMCEKDILRSTKYFGRAREYGETKINKKGEEYRNKKWKRYHLNCAKELSNLTRYENIIIRETNKILEEKKDKKIKNSNFIKELKNKTHKYQEKENSFRIRIAQELYKYEKDNKLTFYSTYVGLVEIEGKKMRIGRKGFSDLIIFFNNGKTVFLELKVKENKLNDNQKQLKIKLEKLGYVYKVVRTLQEFKQLINKYL